MEEMVQDEGNCQIGFTFTQKQRLKELNGPLYIELKFKSKEERQRRYLEITKELERRNKEGLRKVIEKPERHLLKKIESKISNALVKEGFIEVVTPIIISKGSIKKMGIQETSEIWKQIFWLNGKRCLRPMLAPNLYHVMALLRRSTQPVSIFEVGPCFRKDTRGKEHLEEFTMLNAVELAPSKPPLHRLKEILSVALEAVGLSNYKLERIKSEVYGETIDVVINGLEVASAAVGPHPLDKNWNIYEEWAGVGFGIERIAMVKKGYMDMRHLGRSLSHLNGYCLKIQ